MGGGRLTGIAVWVLAIHIVAPAPAALVNYWAFDGNLYDTAGDYTGNRSASATDMEEVFADDDPAYQVHVKYVQGPVDCPKAIETVGATTRIRTTATTKAVFDGTADVAFARSSALAFWVRLPAAYSEFFTDGNRFEHVLLKGNMTASAPGDPDVTVAIPVQEWHFITIVCDDEKNVRSIYVDGLFRASGDYNESGTPSRHLMSLGPPDKSTYWGAVAFARMSVWDHAMSAAEVERLYKHGGDVRFSTLYRGAILLVR
jgi:hypothetical protein